MRLDEIKRASDSTDWNEEKIRAWIDELWRWSCPKVGMVWFPHLGWIELDDWTPPC